VDQTAELASRLAMTGHFVPAMPVGGGHYGIAVLTREASPAPRSVALPHRRPREPRVAAVLPVDVGGRGTITVVGTHLQNGPLLEPRPTEAMRQLAVLLDRISHIDAVAVAGDMNMDRRTAARQLEAHGFDVAVTAPTFPAVRPRRTIDVVAVRGRRILDARVPVTQVSDHRPVVVDIGNNAL
jgi:endonuclease/exonuclease/phosphatase family metal-dependent hydrolase